MTTASPAHDTPAQTPSQPMSLRTRLSAWSEIMQTANPPAELPLDTVGKWLVMTRAAVIPMTLWSGVVGLVLAHAANNLINDYFDMTQGVDTEGYVRALYAPHPVLSGWISRAGLS